MFINIFRSSTVKLFLSFLVLYGALSAQYEPSAERGDAECRRKTEIEANQVRASIFNHNFSGRTDLGQLTHIPYEWPIGTSQHYIALAGIFVGSLIVTEEGDTQPLVTSSNYVTDPVDGSSMNFEPVPEYLNTNSNSIAISTDYNSWPECWPDRLNDVTDQGWCGSWNGYFGKDYFIEGAEIYSKTSDDLNHLLNGTYYPDTTDFTRQGAGIIVQNRTIAWSTPVLDDVLFHIFTIKNDGTKHLDSNVVALWIADFVGGAGDAGDDQANYDLDQEVVWSFDGDNVGNEHFGTDSVGIASYLVLETPDSLGISAIRRIPSNISLLSVNLWNDWLAPGFFWDPIQEPGDFNLVISSGYFALAPGEEKELIYATIFSRNETEMWNKIEDIQFFYNSGFSPNPSQFAVLEMEATLGYVYANDGVSRDSIFLQLNDYYGSPYAEKSIQITNDSNADTLWLLTDEEGATAFQYTTAILPESGQVIFLAQTNDPDYGFEAATLTLNVYSPALIGDPEVSVPFDLNLQAEDDGFRVSWDAEYLPEHIGGLVYYQFKVYRNGSLHESTPGDVGLQRGFWSGETLPDLHLNRYVGLLTHGLPLRGDYRIEFIESQGHSSTEFGAFDGYVLLPSIPVNFCVKKRFPEFVGTGEEWQDIPFAFMDIVGEDSVFNFDAYESDMIIFLDDDSDSSGMGPTWQFDTYSGGHPEDYSIPNSGDIAFLSTRYQYFDENPAEDDNCYYITRFFPENFSSVHFQPMTESLPSEIACSSTISIDPERDTQKFTPRTVILNQNYPNPFNPTTTISYSIPEDTNISLVIYDIRGQVVQTLQSKNQSAGWYDVIWNGETADGKTISTGIYFARLIAGEYTQVIKMLYLK
ncbi:MAG: T9SS type A sorting domain-containing protein [FCB group bacterium]|nr:T9SS type A sorting domain-containing protein [FCB group bacterium]MBL7122138.1 T9SS type A sorting domain-containing protein [Candidatus Neomarinimicrobiota bacterium]